MKKTVFFLVCTLLLLSLNACTSDPTVSVTDTSASVDVSVATVISSETSTASSKDTAVETTRNPDFLTVTSKITSDNYPIVDGSTATIPLAVGLMARITGCTQEQAEESVVFSTTDKSYHQLAEGKADILLVYSAAVVTVNELNIEETMNVKPIGLDALVFFVNADNPVTSLTSDQIRDIYSGKITNWSEVGGSDINIVPFQRPELSGSQTLMLELMMKDVAMTPPTSEFISESMADIIEDVASFDTEANAIGYSVYYYAKNMYGNPDLKFIAVDGVLPSNETINSKEYGFTKPFYCVLPKTATPEAQAMCDYLLTSDGQNFLESCGYVPIMKSN